MPNAQTFWEKSARKYDAQTRKGPNFAARIQRCADWLGPDARVLDAGCASGHITLDLAPHVSHVLGVDIAQTHIDLAAERAAERGLTNAEFVCAPIDDPRFDQLAGTLDGITCFALLHLVDDPKATLARFHQLLKPNGQLILEAPCLSDYSFAIRWLIVVMQWVGKAPPIVNFTLAELEAMIRDAGFEVLESTVHNPKSGQQAIHARKPA
ncbi:class I SAM-dependent methyltransferase [Mucisphaera calidilacus]|uniref:Putative methyltransferase YcgJ n=1 Tax=Mucisphaera calidilacus TaxID=2527982 RepID=A0A518BUV8_9BACT|nr:class I SAM-dependent methyltransferase [Mucisphaera calidilacus]QDU70770.1 putative methyltransferase YcgJ [Mucisphaera calidilacus]